MKPISRIGSKLWKPPSRLWKSADGVTQGSRSRRGRQPDDLRHGHPRGRRTFVVIARSISDVAIQEKPAGVVPNAFLGCFVGNASSQ
jgi:hypothetical protein